jgi:hypothetical protein
VTSGPVHELLDGLGAAARALEGGDPIAASAALDAVVEACRALEDAGVRLDVATLTEASRLHAACGAAAAAVSRQLDGEMQSAGAARRAASAYGR